MKGQAAIMELDKNERYREEEGRRGREVETTSDSVNHHVEMLKHLDHLSPTPKKNDMTLSPL